jgi:hypothetical protein
LQILDEHVGAGAEVGGVGPGETLLDHPIARESPQHPSEQRRRQQARGDRQMHVAQIRRGTDQDRAVDPGPVVLDHRADDVAAARVPDGDDAVDAERVEHAARGARLVLHRVARRRLLRAAMADQVEAHDAMRGGEWLDDRVPGSHRAGEHVHQQHRGRRVERSILADLHAAGREVEQAPDVGAGSRAGAPHRGQHPTRLDGCLAENGRHRRVPAPSPRAADTLSRCLVTCACGSSWSASRVSR